MKAGICCVVALMGAMGMASAVAATENNWSQTPLAVADTSQGQSALVVSTAVDAQQRYDVAYSICQTVAPADYDVDFVSVTNAIIPAVASANYFSNRGISLNPSESIAVTLLDAPKHGVLEHDKYSYGVYLYKPNKDYFGVDRMIFSVEVKGRLFKVIYSVEVDQTPDRGSPSCPTGNGIKELPPPASTRDKQGSLDILGIASYFAI